MFLKNASSLTALTLPESDPIPWGPGSGSACLFNGRNKQGLMLYEAASLPLGLLPALLPVNPPLFTPADPPIRSVCPIEHVGWAESKTGWSYLCKLQSRDVGKDVRENSCALVYCHVYFKRHFRCTVFQTDHSLLSKCVWTDQSRCSC